MFQLDLLPNNLFIIPKWSSLVSINFFYDIHFNFNILKYFLPPEKFRQFDHGLIENFRRYGKFSPPDYELYKVTAPVALHYCVNDWLSSVKDVEILAEQLPNVHAKIKVPHPPFGHLDYIWGMHANELLYEKILGIMNFFSQK